MTLKTVRNLVAPLAIALGAMAVFAVPAAASATGCVFSNPAPRSCVQVIGASTFVDKAGGGVNLGPRQSARGHFLVYDTDGWFHPINSNDTTYWNQSWFHAATFWGPNNIVNMYLPNQDRICAIFWQRRGTGYVRHSPACETVIQ
jgi:hypothetical protein